ncbi:MAG: HIT family protein [Proteobacteria bacterium]|nr:HIT family protein [Pseudomonadota bacterium]
MVAPAYDPNNIFAKILRGEIPCHKVYEDEHVLAFMDIMPRGDGHTLVIPKVAARNILDLPAEAFAPLMAGVQKVARAAKAALDADGITLQQFSEPAGGQVVFHIHFHVIPRWNGVRLRPHTGEMAPGAELAGFAKKIAAAIGA